MRFYGTVVVSQPDIFGRGLLFKGVKCAGSQALYKYVQLLKKLAIQLANIAA